MFKGSGTYSGSLYTLDIQNGEAIFVLHNENTVTTCTTTAETCVYSATSIQTGQWYHLVGTYDGSTARLYVNGAEDGANSFTSTGAANSNAVHIGARSDTTGSDQFDGVIDDVRIYDHALSVDEIARLYRLGR